MGMTEEIAEERCVRPGRRLFIRKLVIGDIRKPPFNLIFVHGLNGSQSQFDPMIECMAADGDNGDGDDGNSSSSTTTGGGGQEQQQSLIGDNSMIVWLYDMVGCGKSPPPDSDGGDNNVDDGNDGAYSNTESALDLHAIITDMVDTTYPTYFVGHSYGPTIVLELLRLPEFRVDNVQGMVFISSALRDGPGLSYPDGGPMIMKLPLFLLQWINPYLVESFLKTSFHADTFRDNPSLVEQTRRACLKNDLSVCRSYIKQTAWATNVLAQHVAKDMPVFIIHGDEDNNISPSCSQHISNVLAMSKLKYIEKSSHMVILEKPLECAQTVLEFINQIQCVYLVRDGFPPMS